MYYFEDNVDKFRPSLHQFRVDTKINTTAIPWITNNEIL